MGAIHPIGGIPIANEPSIDEPRSEIAAWAKRNDHWLHHAKPKRWRAKRERSKEPLILCGHGVSLSVDRGTLSIRDGLTHYPQERATYRFFKGELGLPARIIMLDGSGSLSFDVLAWLSEQKIPLVRIGWTGEVVSVIGGAGFAQIPERVQWQIETRNDNARRLEFSSTLIVEKLRSSLRTLNEALPHGPARAVGIANCENGIAKLLSGNIRSIEEIRMIEANAALAYFNAWKDIPLNWKWLTKYPIPDSWRRFDGRRSIGRNRFATNRNATHPVNAMLNYAYATLRSQIHIEVAGEGYDPCRGIMHHDRDDTQAFVYDLIEPRRPVVDAAVLDFAIKTPLTGADFILRSDGVCRLSPQLARHIATIAVNA
jgi:CRISPR-associated endonuclease Cas1